MHTRYYEHMLIVTMGGDLLETSTDTVGYWCYKGIIRLAFSLRRRIDKRFTILRFFTGKQSACQGTFGALFEYWCTARMTYLGSGSRPS